MDPRIGLAAATALAVMLAGCAGNFDLKQTEPLRVEVVHLDGDGQDARLTASGTASEQAEAQHEFTLETKQVETVTVVVEVTNVVVTEDDGVIDPDGSDNDTSAEPAVVLVTVEDRDTKRKLAQQRVTADDDGAVVNLDVDVKGKDNIVIITQAVEGVADVNVAAKSGGVSVGDDGGVDVTATGSATATQTDDGTDTESDTETDDGTTTTTTTTTVTTTTSS